MTRSAMRTVTIMITLAVMAAILGGCGLGQNNSLLSQQPGSQTPTTQTPVVQPPVTQAPATQTPPVTAPTAAETKQAILDRAGKVVQLLKAKDMNGLATLVHPDKGVRFSAYGNIKTGEKGDLVFSATELKGLLEDKTVRTWGAYDGTGDPINLTYEQYYAKFVYDVDFASAPKTGYNAVIGTGNTLINIKEAYPNGVFVEYHFSGFEAKYGGMDWRSLRLVFENKGGTWYLVGVVHDQWTI